MQSHIVVFFDHETGEFEIDWGTTDIRFAEGLFWNGDKWVDYFNVSEKERKLQTRAFALLEVVLENLSIDVDN